MSKTHLKNQNYQHSEWRENRLVFQFSDQEKQEIKAEVRKNVEAKKDELPKKIKELDTTGTTPEQLQTAIRKHIDAIIEKEFNDALARRGFPMTLDQIRKIPGRGPAIEAELQDGKKEAYTEADKALLDYATAKQAVQKKTAADLAAAASSAPPAPPAAPRLSTHAGPNPARIRLNSEIRATNSQKNIVKDAIEQSKLNPSPYEMVELDKNKIETGIQEITDPSATGGIADYQGWSLLGVTGETNSKNPTRDTLDGMLASGYIFMNDEDKGKQLRDERFAKAKEIYDNSDAQKIWNDPLVRKNMPDFLKNNLPDTKGFTLDDIQTKMGLGKYLKEAEKYDPKSERVKGAIAGIFKYTEDITMFPASLRTEYANYLKEALSDPNFKNATDDSGQMNQLFSLKPAELFMRSALEIHKNSIKDNGLKILDLLPGFHFNDKAPNGFYKFLMGDQDSTFDLPRSSMSMEQKYKLLESIEKSGTKEVTEYQDKVATKLRRDGANKLQQVFDQNKALGRKVLDSSAASNLQKRYNQLSMEFLGNYNSINNGSTQTLVASNYVKNFPATQYAFLDFMDELDRKLAEIQATKSAETPPVAPPVVPPVAPGTTPTGPGTVPTIPTGTTPRSPETGDGADIYARDWNKEIKKSKVPTYKDYTGPMQVTFQTNSGGWTHVRMRKTEDGTVLAEIPRNATVFRDEAIPAKMVDQKTFIKVRFLDPEDNNNAKTGWVDESVLFPKNPELTPSPTKVPEVPVLPKIPENIDPSVRNPYYKATFDRVAREVETTPGGSIFNDLFNRSVIEYRVVKNQGKYHLKFSYDFLQNIDLEFNSIREIREKFDSGLQHRELTYQLLSRPQLYERYTETRKNRDDRKSGKIKTISERFLKDKFNPIPPNTIDMDLDWESKTLKNISGNANLHLELLPGGRIVYRINCDFVAPDGGSVREGIAEDLTDLFSKIAHAKLWTESYSPEQTKPEWIVQESLRFISTEERNYFDYQSRIGRPILFQTIADTSTPVTYIGLDWDRTGNAKSINNPLLTVSPTNKGSLYYTLHYSKGQPDTEGRPQLGMGTYGEVKDFPSLMEKVAQLCIAASQNNLTEFRDWSKDENRPSDYYDRFNSKYPLPTTPPPL